MTMMMMMIMMKMIYMILACLSPEARWTPQVNKLLS